MSKIICRVIGKDFEAESIVMQLRQEDKVFKITVAKNHEFIEQLICNNREEADQKFQETQKKYFSEVE